MKNKEKYAKEIAGIPFSELAMTKDGKICRCRELLCRDCFFNTPNFPFCSDEGDLCCENCYNWLEQEAEPEEPTIDELKSELERVKKENAELRARLDKAVELKSDAVYRVVDKDFVMSEPITHLKVYEVMDLKKYGYFIDRDEAEKELAVQK